MYQDNHIPSLRFKGFEGKWEERKLGAVAQVTMGQSPDGSTYSNKPGGSILVQGNADIKNGWVEPRVWTTQITKQADAGDLIMSVRAPAGAMGKTAYDVVIGRGVAAIQGNEFLYQLLVKRDIDGLWKQVSSGSTFDALNAENIKSTDIYIPSTEEQNKIGAYLEKLDLLISLQHQKLDKLEDFKKAMLDKMFPQKGSRVPEIRFQGFAGVWEEKKFSELYEKRNDKNDLTYGPEKIISVANMYYKPDAYITDPNYFLTYNVFELGDIAFEGNKSKSYAHGRFVENTIGNGIVSHVFDVFRPIMNPYDLFFWKYAINNESLMGKILIRCTKSSIMMNNLVAHDFLEESFLVPSIQEQEKIGAFLNSIDRLLSLHCQKLEKLQAFKKAMLGQMFPPERTAKSPSTLLTPALDPDTL